MNPRRKITRAATRKRPATMAALDRRLTVARAAAEAAEDADSATFQARFEACSRVVDQILKHRGRTFRDLQTKARALAWCYSGEPGGKIHLDEHAGTTDYKLVFSILADLLGGNAVDASPRRDEPATMHPDLEPALSDMCRMAAIVRVALGKVINNPRDIDAGANAYVAFEQLQTMIVAANASWHAKDGDAMTTPDPILATIEEWKAAEAATYDYESGAAHKSLAGRRAWKRYDRAQTAFCACVPTTAAGLAAALAFARDKAKERMEHNFLADFHKLAPMFAASVATAAANIAKGGGA